MSSAQSSRTASVPYRSDDTNDQKALEEDEYAPQNSKVPPFPPFLTHFRLSNPLHNQLAKKTKKPTILLL